ncbi:MAG: Ig-like domain-containing protein [Prevotella sp.]|nr:Ig-like domain-containing protein [Prevotella sp.]
MKKKILLSLMLMLFTMSSFAALTKKAQGGWYESCWMEFTGLSSSYSQYNGYVSADGGTTWTKLDGQLVRSYGSYGRVDALGLTAGSNYKLKVVPVKDGSEVEADAVISNESMTVKNYDRSGFAHFNWASGVGAYNNDGTLKANTQILYITSSTAKTVKMDVVSDTKGNKKTFTGLQAIVTAYQKGLETRPLCVRFIGKISANDMDGFDSSEEGIQIKGKDKDWEMNMTFEGVGNDAFIYGFGFLVRNCKSVEMRNFGVATLMDDDISLDTDNDHIWIHNIDAFYGKQGGGDHAKGDGAIDVKSDSKHVTVSYCHFWDTGKSTMCGMKSESGPNYITYHHNWFDHSDSRHARVRTMSVHMYNNYYDNIAKYGAGATTGSSVFVEANYFKNCSKPMLISMQGTDTKNGTDEKNAPTFSKEDGGIIKSFNNAFSGSYTLARYSSTNTVHFDCYEAQTRDEQVPSNVKAKQGEATYNNFDTDNTKMYSYTPDAAADVPSIVSSREWGAGRMQGGDFVFDLSSEPASDYNVNPALRSAIDNYNSSFVAIIGEESSTEPVDPSDTRDESTFTITSKTDLTLDEGATSTITFENAAGAVTYSTNNDAIASVDNAGNITAVGAGKTMITVTDAGSETVKGASRTIAVTVIGTVVVDGDVIIQCGTLPNGYAVDDAREFAQYKYSSSDWINNANLFLVDASQHTVTIPEGVKVTAVTLYAVGDNNTAAKGKITELAGKTFSVDLPSRKSGTALATATVDNLSVTGELTFTITYKSGVKLSLKVEATSSSIQDVNTVIKNSEKVIKYVENGQIIIVKNGKRYTVSGVQIK